MIATQALVALVLSTVPVAMAFRVPEGAWDSHIHIIDPERFPMEPDRDYTPKSATTANATSFQSARGIKHSVIVLPSVYGTNNSVLLDALWKFKGQYRGVAVIDPENITEDELDEMHEAGVRGLRVNLGTDVPTDTIISSVKLNAAIAKSRDWVVQLWVPLKAFVALHSILPTLGITFVADHFAHAEVGSKTNETINTIDPYKSEGFPEVIDLVQRKLLFVKISAPYQNSKQAPLYEDMRVVAESLIAAGPDMVVYGSDWPHTSSKEGNAAAGGRLSPQEYRDINDAALVEVLKDWAGSQAQVQRIFVDNPRRLWRWYTEGEL
ncbi:hypothetical protein G7Z17_g7869 [Cylindrodendrum hubeiense]|uniref:Amidohydrolase-related domain-containing protein n=1 Tax=Cylindrodendrum hubeiense TaxID=595255 RepID=A0A9P5HAN9_9HYPO|nr:hypothetical protein G7Z17_g7869 [Cylindrodendrum hubeiense]